MIPLCLITGFLGSGKTTFLKKTVAKYPDRKFVYLINEFSQVDIDGELMKDEKSDTLSIPGGSIFCKCLVSQFIETLSNIPARFSTDERPVEGVVIEASGVADPGVVRTMLEETRLDKVYELGSVISIADPKSLFKLLKTLPNIKTQIEASDRVIINKTDICSEEEIQRAELDIREINSAAEMRRTSFCDVDFDIFSKPSASGQRHAEGDYAKCRDPNYGRLSISGEGLNLERLKRHLAKVEDEVYRLKGFIRDGGTVFYVDYSKAGWEIKECSNAPENVELALIVKGPSELYLQNHFNKLQF